MRQIGWALKSGAILLRILNNSSDSLTNNEPLTLSVNL